MAEREALKREIEELQSLIDNYKNTHGDIPSSSARWDRATRGSRRGRDHGSRYMQSYSAMTQPYMPHSAGSWRKTYSLSNTSTQTTGKHVSHPYSHASNVNQPSHHIGTTSTATVTQDITLVRSNEKTPETQTLSKSAASSLKGETVRTKISRTVLISASRQACNSQSSANNPVDSTLSLSNLKAEPDRKIKPNLVVTNPAVASPVKQKSVTQVKSILPTASSSNRTVILPAANRDLSLASDSNPQAVSSPTKVMPKPHPDVAQTRVTVHQKPSQFTWVKKEDSVNVKNMPKTKACSTETSISSFAGSTYGNASVRRVSGSNKKISRKSPGGPKTSKYTWVSSACSSSAAGKTNMLTKQLRKSLSPKSYKVSPRTAQGGLDLPKKLRNVTTSTVLAKKSKAGCASTSHVGNVSRYRWKAAGQNATSNASGTVPASVRKNTVYRWTANKNSPKGERGSALLSSAAHSSSPSTPVSSGAFRLRSRTKIIRKFTSNSPSLERRSPVMLTSRSRYSLRRRTHGQVKTPTSARRAQSKVLVSFGKHKLRRLSLTATSLGNSRSGPPFPSMRSPTSHRVIKTRYKIDTRRAQPVHHSPALSYRVKRVQSARILLQNRLRTTPERHWRGRSMRWIGGALYKVSANKLSRTHTVCTPNSKTGEWYNPDVSSASNQAKTSATRYVASRAVQRSLAIIRQAHQKKQKAKQYCMYYNRFGKCNHGDACPYIHDPDKVAVCTRFLRGTCKQTDGTCPFSHKVAKEKMPVCSYFLKGICNNSSCPYSHVYVSRKAEVCQDFVRGYCPQGDKCKKQHTLVCPDFSSTGACPRGSKCKLRHRQKTKRTSSNPNTGPAKRPRNTDTAKRSEEQNHPSAESKQADEHSDPKKLPSFISLSSTPDTAEKTNAQDVPPPAGLQAKGKTLHIKPRF